MEFSSALEAVFSTGQNWIYFDGRLAMALGGQGVIHIAPGEGSGVTSHPGTITLKGLPPAKTNVWNYAPSLPCGTSSHSPQPHLEHGTTYRALRPTRNDRNGPGRTRESFEHRQPPQCRPARQSWAMVDWNPQEILWSPAMELTSATPGTMGWANPEPFRMPNLWLQGHP